MHCYAAMTKEDAVSFGMMGFCEGMLAAAAMCDRFVEMKLPPSPHMTADQHKLMEATRRFTLESIATAIREDVKRRQSTA